MPRARNIKPAFFKNEDLVEQPFEVRLLFIGLWTLADREGKLEDRPKRIKMELYPADNVDVDAALDALNDAGLILRYSVDGQRLILIPRFAEHQNPHRNEAPSVLPDPTCDQGQKDLRPRTEALGLNPDSLNPDKNTCAHPRTANRFDDFWNAYPVKRDKKKAREKWKTKRLDAKADEIIADVQQRSKRDAQWLGGYIPLPTTYLNGERWEDEMTAPKPKSNGSAWNEVLAASGKSADDRKQFLDEHPDIREAINAAGGLKQIGLLNEWQQKEARQKFEAAMQA